MSGAAEGASVPLEWPPLAEDLRRLYVEQGLSASKVAKVYGLKYASSKTAESTILYQLKKNGISRRDPAAHVRKVTEMMVDEWVVRYQRGESLKQIAGEAVGPVTVFNHLHRRGIQLRDKVEAQIQTVTIHRKHPFVGDSSDAAYLCGLALGDFGVTRHGRAIRVKLSTTHPAMGTLFRNLFSAEGPIYEYPRLNAIVGHQWSFDCDLDSTFEFLLVAKGEPAKTARDEEKFLSFLAGLFDAEGSIYFHRKGTSGAFELSITNTNLELLTEVHSRIEFAGFHSVLRKVRIDREVAIKSGMTNPSESMWRIVIWRIESVNRFLQALALRHPEKVSKAKIALCFGLETSSSRRGILMSEWGSLIERIHADCENYIGDAKTAWQVKHSPKQPKKADLDSV